MCVIAVKCKGSDFAPLDAIEKCIQTNPDGFSFAWNENGEIKTFKTMNPTEAMAKYKELSETLNPLETSLVFHARIKSHGSIDIKNCHCWTHGNIAFAHNGVLSNIKNRDDMTDSETFFRDLFVPAMEGCGLDFALKMSRAVIGNTNNKFALVDGNGNVYMTSGAYTFIKIQFAGKKGKIYFSNDYWMPRNNYSFGIGFDPYADIRGKRPAGPGTNTQTSSGLPSAKPGKKASPKNPLAITRKEPTKLTRELLEERYQALF